MVAVLFCVVVPFGFVWLLLGCAVCVRWVCVVCVLLGLCRVVVFCCDEFRPSFSVVLRVLCCAILCPLFVLVLALL